MKRPIEGQSIDRATIFTSLPAALIWLGVLAFLAKWFQAWCAGGLEAGVNTSRRALLVLFLLAFSASVSGICLSVEAWRGKSNLRWQVGSLIGAALTLWAVSGD